VSFSFPFSFPFPWPLALAIYFTIWWVTLLAILPLGVRSLHEEEQSDAPAGADPGAPVAPRLWMKAGLTTLASAVIFGLVVIAANFG
jgi:predicted secreted protein